MLLPQTRGHLRSGADLQKLAEFDGDAARHVSRGTACYGRTVGRNGNVRGRVQLAVQDEQVELYGRHGSGLRQYGAGRCVGACVRVCRGSRNAMRIPMRELCVVMLAE